MKRLAVAAVLVCSSFAFAITKEEAQKKMDEASAKACESAKTLVSKETACADEKAKLDAVDCANGEQRKASKYMDLNSACMKKVKTAGKGAAAKAEVAPKAEPKAPAKTEAAPKAEPAKAPAK
jgi:hypothetical protein